MRIVPSLPVETSSKMKTEIDAKINFNLRLRGIDLILPMKIERRKPNINSTTIGAP
jgi:hypothetical protein